MKSSDTCGYPYGTKTIVLYGNILSETLLPITYTKTEVSIY